MTSINHSKNVLVIEMNRINPSDYKEYIIKSISTVMQLYVLTERIGAVYDTDYENLTTISIILRALSNTEEFKNQSFIHKVIDEENDVLRMYILSENSREFNDALVKLMLAVLRWCNSECVGDFCKHDIYVFAGFIDQILRVINEEKAA